MSAQPARNPSDRDLRSLDLKEFLALVQEDIQELDERRRQRRKLEKEEPPSPSTRKGRQKVAEAEPEEEDEILPLTLHVVTCCGKRMGSFPGFSRVRCPFCEQWHTAGEFPECTGT